MRLRVRVLLGAFVPAGLVVLWWMGANARVVSHDALPPPIGVVEAAVDHLSSGRLGSALVHSLTIVVVGWLGACAIGVFTGLVLGLSRLASTLTHSSVEVARAVPAVALVPVAILIFGFDMRAELLVVVFAALWPVLINTAAAFRQLPVQLLDTARTLELGPVERVRKVFVPAAMPRIFVGLRLALATAVTLMAVAEMTGNPAGLGNEIVMAQSSVQPAAAMFYTLIIGILGLVLNWVLVGIGRLPGLRRMSGAAL